MGMHIVLVPDPWNSSIVAAYGPFKTTEHAQRWAADRLPEDVRWSLKPLMSPEEV